MRIVRQWPALVVAGLVSACASARPTVSPDQVPIAQEAPASEAAGRYDGTYRFTQPMEFGQVRSGEFKVVGNAVVGCRATDERDDQRGAAYLCDGAGKLYIRFAGPQLEAWSVVTVKSDGEALGAGEVRAKRVRLRLVRVSD